MSDPVNSAGSRWTPEEDGLLRSLAVAGESVAAITKPLRRSEYAVRKRALRLKIKLARFPPGPKAKGK